MAADGGTVELTYKAKLDQLEREMAGLKSKVGRHADDAGDGFSKRFASKLGSAGAMAGKALAVGLAGAAVGAGAILKGAFDAAEESRKVGAQTAAVIQSTGGAAKVSAKQVASLSDEIAGFTGIDDEMIASGANMLLTFTNVRNEVGKGNNVFDQATMAATNMSVALGKDLPSSAMLVGKALNDPIKGMSALTKSGIQFTTQQKDQVAAMVKAGDTLGAQKIILKELETQFGGSAAAAASPMARLKVVVGNLQEELGARLLPVVATVATFLADKLPGAMDAVGRGFSFIKSGVMAVVEAFRSFSSFGEWEAHGNFERLGVAMAKVVGFVRETLLPAIGALVGFVRDNLGPVLAAVGVVVLTVLVPAFIAWAVAAGTAAIATITAAAPLIALAALLGALAYAVVYAYQHFESFRTVVDAVASFLLNVVKVAFESIAHTVTSVIDIITGVIKLGLAIIKGDWSGAWEAVKGILAAAWNLIVGVIRSQFEVVNALFAGLPGRILGALGDLGTLLYQAGRDLIMGMLNGIKSMAGALADAARGVARGAVNAVKGFLGIGSPSKLFMGFGVNIGQGLAIGMERSVGMVAGAGDVLASAASGYGASLNMSSMGHSSAADSGGGSSSGGSHINVGPFYVKEGDLSTEIPRRIRGALHLTGRG